MNYDLLEVGHVFLRADKEEIWHYSLNRNANSVRTICSVGDKLPRPIYSRHLTVDLEEFCIDCCTGYLAAIAIDKLNDEWVEYSLETAAPWIREAVTSQISDWMDDHELRGAFNLAMTELEDNDGYDILYEMIISIGVPIGVMAESDKMGVLADKKVKSDGS